VSDPGGPPGPGRERSPEGSSLSDLPGVASLAVLGTTIASCLGVFVWLGLWADSAWHSSPWGLLLGIVLGTVAAVVSVVKLVRRFL
jgi:F0F1-type ATP synthase assembly protein I